MTCAFAATSASAAPSCGPIMDGLVAAMNGHDIDRMVALFADDYRSEQPLNPGSEFVGSAIVRRNWTGIFTRLPDFEATVVRCAVNGDESWAELRWKAGFSNGVAAYEWPVTIIVGADRGLIAWGRLYMNKFRLP